jgi:hypothetical protein
MIKMQIEGEEQVIAELDNIVKALDSGRVQGVLKTNGQRIIDSARAMAPHKTGTLKRAIGWISKSDKQFRNVALIGIKATKNKSAKANPGKYGNIIQTDSRTGKRRANKFMQMALEINQNAVTEGIKKGLENIIKNPKTNQ